MGFGFGPGQLMLLAIVVVLLFGNRIPQVMHAMGLGVSEFRRGLDGVEDRLEE